MVPSYGVFQSGEARGDDKLDFIRKTADGVALNEI
jgi:hypothetical protein